MRPFYPNPSVPAYSQNMPPPQQAFYQNSALQQSQGYQNHQQSQGPGRQQFSNQPTTQFTPAQQPHQVHQIN